MLGLADGVAAYALKTVSMQFPVLPTDSLLHIAVSSRVISYFTTNYHHLCLLSLSLYQLFDMFTATLFIPNKMN